MPSVHLPNLAPDVFRQRLLIEGVWTIDVDADVVRRYLLEVAAHLELRIYGEPVVYSPGKDMGSEENLGFDAFVPLIDSGISGYFWSGPRFLSVLLYTCKGFDETGAVDFTRKYFAIDGETVAHSF